MSKKAKSILVVDDDELIIKMLERLLSTVGYDIDTATGGNIAGELILERNYDLVITDLTMPEGDGKDLISLVKKEKPNLPVIVITGHSDIDLAVDCMKEGASDFIMKPVSLDKLLESVNEFINKISPQHRTHSDTGEATCNLSSGVYKVIAGHRIIRTLGEGSMGIVYLANDQFDTNGQEVALKVLKTGAQSSEEQRAGLERFLHEAEAAGRIEHENIVKIIDYGLDDDAFIPYILMEYINGRPIKQHVKMNPGYTYKEILILLIQVAKGLQAVHDVNIYHRDVKPNNIIITVDGVAKLTDFGVAKVPESELTVDSNIIGTPAYLPPEAFQNVTVDHRSDIYSFGVVMYEVCTGERPFQAESIGRFAHMIQRDDYEEPGNIAPHFPIELSIIIRRCMEKNRNDRYESFNALIKDLNVYIERESTVIISDFSSHD
ncbi:protein kinase [bacterium AH-315-E10]|nr:protein kinase [bacterium AH-315-E10]